MVGRGTRAAFRLDEKASENDPEEDGIENEQGLDRGINPLLERELERAVLIHFCRSELRFTSCKTIGHATRWYRWASWLMAGLQGTNAEDRTDIDQNRRRESRTQSGRLGCHSDW
jgi:hypothetical protein